MKPSSMACRIEYVRNGGYFASLPMSWSVPKSWRVLSLGWR